ncbi:hypothetical protein F5Y03DRAFT_357323 [Xylaria venustula]|nr:hypothetical protein F5Y03DRAFT_357323 [Xylaria venustula]
MQSISETGRTKTKAAELERTRNNQRRSRARRKEYITELEEKIRRYETLATQNVPDETIHSVIRENIALKRLLHSMGLGDDFVTSYMTASKMAIEMSKNTTGSELHPRLDNENRCGTRQCSTSKTVLEDTVNSLAMGLQALDPPAAVLSFNPADSAVSVPQGQTTPYQFLESTPLEDPLEFSSYMNNAATTLKLSELSVDPPNTAQMYDLQVFVEDAERVKEDTTLCSVAFSLIMLINRKDYDAANLDLKLRAGYRYGQGTVETCRIDNSILLRVLTEIM